MFAQPKTIFWSLYFSGCILGGLLFAETGEDEALQGKIQNPQDPGVSPLNLDPYYTKILYCKGFRSYRPTRFPTLPSTRRLT